LNLIYPYHFYETYRSREGTSNELNPPKKAEGNSESYLSNLVHNRDTLDLLSFNIFINDLRSKPIPLFFTLSKKLLRIGNEIVDSYIKPMMSPKCSENDDEIIKKFIEYCSLEQFKEWCNIVYKVEFDQACNIIKINGENVEINKIMFENAFTDNSFTVSNEGIWSIVDVKNFLFSRDEAIKRFYQIRRNETYLKLHILAKYMYLSTQITKDMTTSNETLYVRVGYNTPIYQMTGVCGSDINGIFDRKTRTNIENQCKPQSRFLGIARIMCNMMHYYDKVMIHFVVFVNSFHDYRSFKVTKLQEEIITFCNTHRDIKSFRICLDFENMNLRSYSEVMPIKFNLFDVTHNDVTQFFISYSFGNTDINQPDSVL